MSLIGIKNVWKQEFVLINGNKSENRIFYGRIRTSHIFDGQTLAPGALLNTVNQSHDSAVCGIHKNKYKATSFWEELRTSHKHKLLNTALSESNRMFWMDFVSQSINNFYYATSPTRTALIRMMHWSPEVWNSSKSVSWSELFCVILFYRNHIMVGTKKLSKHVCHGLSQNNNIIIMLRFEILLRKHLFWAGKGCWNCTFQIYVNLEVDFVPDNSTIKSALKFHIGIM